MSEQKIDVGFDLALAEYEPEMWTCRKDYIYAAIHAIGNGLEYTNMCLIEHDAALGRTTSKNKTWAEKMEADIRQMTETLEWLRNI
jgi:hypothetical protein